MGLGDDLMITGIVEQERKKHPDKQIVIGNLNKNLVFDSIIYLNNPYITPSDKINRNKPVHFINYNDENRFYINYFKSNENNYVWRTDFKPVPGKIYFSEKELSEAKNVLKNANIFWSKKQNFELQIFEYENADHGFNCDDRKSYNKPSSVLALKRTLNFIEREDD